MATHRIETAYFSPQIISSTKLSPDGSRSPVWGEQIGLHRVMRIHNLDVIVPEAAGKLSPQAIAEQELVRVRYGAFVSAASVPVGATKLELGQIMTLARMVSLDLAMHTSPRPEFTMEAALMVQGIEVWSTNPGVVYRRRGSDVRRSSRRLPAMIVRGVLIPEVTERQIVSPAVYEAPCVTGDVLTAPLLQIAVDCARYLHPMPAIVAVSAVLRRLSFFSYHNMEDGRRFENECRAEMLEIAYKLENRGSRQAQAVIRLADAGVETADEGYLLWVLTCILPGSDRVQFEVGDGRLVKAAATPGDGSDLVTRYEMRTSGGWYVAQFVIPSCGVVIEFDGESAGAKRGKDPSRRHRDMVNTGWKVVCVDRKDLRFPDTLIRHLVSELRRCGVRAGYCFGTMWRPVTESILAQAKWY